MNLTLDGLDETRLDVRKTKKILDNGGMDMSHHMMRMKGMTIGDAMNH